MTPLTSIIYLFVEGGYSSEGIGVMKIEYLSLSRFLLYLRYMCCKCYCSHLLSGMLFVGI